MLNVWYQDTLVGNLWQDDFGRIGFRYDSFWCINGFAISQQLPLSKQEYTPDDKVAHLFFANLLPEEHSRKHIVRNLKISDTDYNLLEAIGGECAGAFSLLPEKIEPKTQINYKKLDERDFSKILVQRSIISNTSNNDSYPRLSLAGAQDKCALLYDGSNYFLPEGAAASSHIIKFDITDIKNVPLYEYFLTKLAASIGLPVVDVELRKLGRLNYLLIKRYDREFERDLILRLHQEDFCQALGCAEKYEENSGPGFVDCFELLQKISSNPVVDLDNLLKWQIFNYLAGNSDAHAKNIALLYKNNQIRLAPFYDLVCTRAIKHLDIKLAMAIGGEFNPDKVTRRHIEKFADMCKIRASYVVNKVIAMAESLLDKTKKGPGEFEEIFSKYPQLERVQRIVVKQSRRALRELR